MLGLHWIADARGCPRERLTRVHLGTALRELPDRLGLRRVSEPQLFEHEDDSGAADSIAGLVLIAESHVSLHAFVAQGALHADVFSCRAVDFSLARSYLAEHFGALQISETMLERG
jgi:S-adenosylmethionine decarboxylase